ncbi:serine threonine phosphatase 6 regulatory ankyrin repeat subunit A [Fusarium tjaetaba]|uniref:Serine threonine phosphatase 6 regulatory ankyrin repeat subunit A n=1 Tax=Fusarium tjaetaba TaxID=1567544 RepID=A0A8H5QW03_9HYPO|nr:serine threonine phosphatase 6 regulatory ankyrin repeat subunit A [Fusarium tjaetaba]KAF5624085.1 serine threonine phosphatase 6 regulatory ankyrin repeat subunit A [Fusarium tjaetaba]
MSSTSAEVGELFNGRGIVRTMGQPEIAQFIVFPDELLKEKKGAQNQSYGIHTLKSASQEGILYKEDLAAQTWLKSFKRTETRKKDFEQAEDEFVPSISRIERATPLQKNDRFPKYWDSLKYPNLQLNIATEKISPKKRSIKLHLAALIAVILQASLLVIAAVVPYRAQDYESQPWGLPCYIGGSVLLFIGMLACPIAIERSTKEFKWRPSSGIDNETQASSEVRTQSIDLFWVQRMQRGPQENKSARSEEDRRLESDFLAVTAIFAGGAGFTVQFIGLMGLPWPCAVAQLGAIIVMAIIRALVRRRLGDDPDYCSAPSRVSSLSKEDSASSQSSQSNEAQRNMLVRKRLGDLVRWETEAFKPALALARSIERFLDEFMPTASDQNLI